MATLEQLMAMEKPSPKQMELQARYSNAQFAVDLGYRLAEKQVYLPDVKLINPDWKEGDAKYDKFDYKEATSEAKAQELVKIARLLKVEIEKDLNDTLKVLEAQDGAKTDAPKLP